MTALARLHHIALELHGIHEISDAYPEAVREYRNNIAERRLRREVNVIKQRLLRIDIAKVDARMQGRSTAWLESERVRQNRRLAECRDELARLQR